MKRFLFVAALFCSLPAFADDWPMWGGDPSRNMTSDATNIPASFGAGEYVMGTDDIDPATTSNVKYVVKLGSQTFGNPVVADGRILLGTNNDMPTGAKYKGDRSLIVCLDEQTGELIWQYNGPKLGAGKVGDWEYLGICSSPAVDVASRRVYFISNLCEVVCLDLDGLANGNDGVTDEADFFGVELGDTDADIIWRFDMTEQLGVFPHNITSSSPLVVGDRVYAATSNGVDWSHVNVPNPRAPALICLDKHSGELLGEEASGVSERLMHSNWSSPAYGKVGDREMIIFGAGDGYVYAFNPEPVQDEDGFGILEEYWRYDCNDQSYRFDESGEPRRYATRPGPSECIGTAAFHDGKVYAAIGQDPEHGEGVGMINCIDASGNGDISETGRIWRSAALERSISTASIHNGLCFIADYSGRVHCYDAQTGEHLWMHDTLGHIWGSTLAVDGKVFIGNEDGYLTVLAASREKNVLHEIEMGNAVYSSAIIGNGVLYIATQSHLYAVEAE